MKKTEISIIITYYKKRKFILETLKSIYDQSFQNYELIFVFDQKNNEDVSFLRTILKKFKNKKFIMNKKNLGVALSRNKAIKECTGPYIAFIDSDDIWKKNKLLYQINYMKKNNADLSYTTYDVMNSKNNFIGFRKVSKSITYKKLIQKNEIGLSTVILKSSILKNNKFPILKTQEDFGLWLRLIKKGYNFKSLNQSFSKWRKLNNSLSSNIFQKIFDAFKLFYLYENMSFFKSIYSVIVLSINKLKKLN